MNGNQSSENEWTEVLKYFLCQIYEGCLNETCQGIVLAKGVEVIKNIHHSC
jgi:hypothetical protein